MNLSTGAPHANHARDPSAKSAERKRRRMRAEHVCLGRRSTCAVTQTSDRQARHRAMQRTKNTRHPENAWTLGSLEPDCRSFRFRFDLFVHLVQKTFSKRSHVPRGARHLRPPCDSLRPTAASQRGVDCLAEARGGSEGPLDGEEHGAADEGIFLVYK